jgi:hypothetical protein
MKKIVISRISALALLALLSFLSCITPGTENVDPDKPRKGTVSGLATDATGKPLPQAAIVINNTQYYNHNILGQTDAHGKYSLTLTPGSWYVRGTTKIRFDNKNYVLDLHPDTDEAFAGTEGAVRNLSLKIAGERTGQFGNNGYYGGQVEVFTWGLDAAQITVTLQPVGPLLDGSVGSPLVSRLNQTYIDDVPLGKYTLTARLGNRPLRVRIRNTGQEYANAVTASFDPAYPGAEGRYKLNLEVSE